MSRAVYDMNGLQRSKMDIETSFERALDVLATSDGLNWKGL